jgi:hypothetical protein
MPNNNFRVWFVGGEGFAGLCWSLKLCEITVPISCSFFSDPKLRRARRIKNVAGTLSRFKGGGNNLPVVSLRSTAG